MKKAKILFVLHYAMYREDWFDVIYESGRVVTYTLPDLPKTVQAFLEESNDVRKQYSKVFNRDEWIYSCS